MIVAQALAERGLLDSLASSLISAVEQIDYYVGEGNTKWVLIGLAVVFGLIFFRTKR